MIHHRRTKRRLRKLYRRSRRNCRGVPQTRPQNNEIIP